MANTILNLLKYLLTTNPLLLFAVCKSKFWKVHIPYITLFPGEKKNLERALFYKFKMYIKQSRLLKAGQKWFLV